MKVTVDTKPRKFEPITVSIKLENIEDLYALSELVRCAKSYSFVNNECLNIADDIEEAINSIGDGK